ncbi:hypothetical protein Ancab_032913 [Ancistrocladus abbreviatus]
MTVRNVELVVYLEMVRLVGPCKSTACCLSVTLLPHSPLAKACHLVKLPNGFRTKNHEWTDFSYLSIPIFEVTGTVQLQVIEVITSAPSCSLNGSSDDPSLIVFLHIPLTMVAIHSHRFDDLGKEERVSSAELGSSIRVNRVPTS